MTRSRTGLALALAALPLAAPPARAQAITGAGSTFAAPIYGKWAEASHAATGVTLNYQAIGSGAGQNQVFNRTVDFGASDAPVPADKLASNSLIQFPAVMGAVDVIVNVPGVAANQLRLTGDLLGAIYLGQVAKWNDPRIAALNPGVTLPALAIAPVHRADGSGTTFVFTDYLSMVSPDWKAKVGAGTSVSWPGGAGARGSDGVAGNVKNIRGGIGYVESAYAEQNHQVTVMLKNRDGSFVPPTTDAFAAAASAADWKGAKDFAIDLNNEPGAASWPIVSATFVLLPTNPKDAAQSRAVLRFFDWGYASGDGPARDLLYVPLPAAVKDAVRAAWSAIQADGKPVWTK